MILVIKKIKISNSLGIILIDDTKQGLLESTTEITQNKHVKVLHYFVDDIKLLK
jgi:hypothetical protein